MSDEKTKDAKRAAMLRYIRDTLIERGGCMREAFELNDLLYARSPEGKAHLRRVVALEAAADIFTLLVGEWDKPDTKQPEWLRTIAKQGMATFVERYN